MDPKERIMGRAISAAVQSSAAKPEKKRGKIISYEFVFEPGGFRLGERDIYIYF